MAKILFLIDAADDRAESWLQNWVAGKEGSVAETTLKKYRQTCTAFVDQLGSRARASLASISPADIVKFRDRSQAGRRKRSMLPRLY